MDFGVRDTSERYNLAGAYRKHGASGTGGGVSFAELAAAKAAEQPKAPEISFEENAQKRRLMEQETKRSAGYGAAGLIQAAEEKAAQEHTADYDEKAFEMVGPNAPQDVKDAWLGAAKEVNANGLGIQGNGMMTHISQMMVQRLNKMMKGETENLDILGNSVESAISAAKQALYQLEHPIVDTPKSIEVQQARIREREFYLAFLERLEQLREA